MGRGGGECQLRILYVGKLSIKNEKEIKTFQGNGGSSLWVALPFKNAKGKKKEDKKKERKKNAKGRLSGWNKRTPDSNSKPYEETKNFSKGNYTDKYKNQCCCILVCNSSLCFPHDWQDKYILKIIIEGKRRGG